MRARRIRPLESRGRWTIVAIIAVSAVLSCASVILTVHVASRSQHQAPVLEIATRQRTLAERYLQALLLAHQGQHADWQLLGATLTGSARALLDGGVAPGIDGDDDETVLPRQTATIVRHQLEQESRLASDLVTTGAAWLADSPAAIPLSAGEHPLERAPVDRLRILTALTSNVSLNAARSIGQATDANSNRIVTTQIWLGVLGLLASVGLALALIAVTRRQVAHFRSMVISSEDLVLIFGPRGARYASDSVERLLGATPRELDGWGFLDRVHPEDRDIVRATAERGERRTLLLRVTEARGGERHLEAQVTDLRADRHVRGIVLNARDVTERVALEQELTHQAFHDNLTGLANRALFRDHLTQALARATRSRQTLAVLLLDLDGFKQVNDSLGHDTGDMVLSAVAERFAAVTRPSDTLARLGGDEFALLTEDIDEAKAGALATRLLDCLTKPVTVGGRTLRLGASVGVVVQGPGAMTAADLLRRADVAMYAAKHMGRNRFELFRDEMGREVGERLGLEQDLRLGLERGEMLVHYQPEIDLASDAIVGAEALLRWTSPTRGSVPPGCFIPIAETSGFIAPLGEFVLREACRQAASWSREHRLDPRFVMWVNVSGVQLTQGGVCELVLAILEEQKLPASMLGLEITESVIVEEGPAADRAQRELQLLHDRGVKVAIDDFGTGFSALGQLRRFPVDLIKVDRSFITAIHEQPKDAAITTGLINLAHALGLQAIAEGIECEEQLDVVRELGCDLAQGFLLARPMPPADVEDLLARRMLTAEAAPT
jgi:diguanylate cyclase (GGDEF)-like protein/PAS domain S-box-containing protein